MVWVDSVGSDRLCLKSRLSDATNKVRQVRCGLTVSFRDLQRLTFGLRNSYILGDGTSKF